MSTTKRLAAIVGAGALVFAMFGTAFAGDVDYATVTGHQASTAENNSADFWGDNCTKLNAGDAGLEAGSHTYVLLSDYALVVVKTGASNGSDPNSLTLFANPTAGQTVWADSNGNSVYDSANNPDDQGISHIIFCDAAESTPTPTFSLDTGGTTDEPTGPATDSLGTSHPSSPADGAWLLVVALGVLLASVVVLTPARAKSRR
jgi:hypothetical protein